MQNHSVLVVDDELLVRMNTSDILRDAGFVVYEAPDASSALLMLQSTPEISLVCTDVQMPGPFDGIELALRIQRDHPNIRVIVTSGRQRNAERVSDVPFLSKPFLSRSLVDLACAQLAA